MIFAVSPQYKQTHSQRAVQCLTHAITESLGRASGANCISIAIPAISSGICEFPLDTIATAVHDNFKGGHHKRSSYLNKVCLVNNDTAVNAMAEAVKMIFHDLNPSCEFPQALSRANRQSGNQWEGEKPWPYSDREGEREWQTSHSHIQTEEDRRAGRVYPVYTVASGGLEIIGKE